MSASEGKSSTTKVLDKEDRVAWAAVKKLIATGRHCPNCARKMKHWPGCESPNCPVPRDIQAEFFASF